MALLGLGWVYALGHRRGLRRCRSGAYGEAPEGGQELTAQDRQYQGSRFADLQRALFDPAERDRARGEPYYRVWGDSNEKPLPVHRVSLGTLARGLFSLTRPFEFLRASKRTLRSQADLRWGDDGKGFHRLLHPNGVCLSGTWIIDAAPEGAAYTGYFKPGSQGLVIARYSPCCAETRGGRWRSLSLVGKLFPTLDPQHVTPLKPAHFITQEDLGGTRTHSVREAVLTNSPPVSPWRRGKGIGVFFLTVATLLRADKQPAERQLYEIAELGKPPGEKTSAPRFLRLTLNADETPALPQEPMDCRDEILSMIYDRGDPQPQRPLVFNIEVSDAGERTGLLTQRLHGQQWTPIGRLVFREAAASYNGDFVVHFHHAPWREDRNDPGSVARPVSD